MENIRPHHIVCLTRLYSALSLFNEDKELYYNYIKNELIKNNNLRQELLDDCKVTWGTIYTEEVMEVLSKIIKDGKFITSDNVCDSICSVCYGKVDGVCVAEEKIQIMDNISRIILNLQSNVLTTTDFIDYRDFDIICNMCGTKEKCDLIRRAIQNN